MILYVIVLTLWAIIGSSIIIHDVLLYKDEKMSGHDVIVDFTLFFIVFICEYVNIWSNQHNVSILSVFVMVYLIFKHDKYISIDRIKRMIRL